MPDKRSDKGVRRLFRRPGLRDKECRNEDVVPGASILERDLSLPLLFSSRSFGIAQLLFNMLMNAVQQRDAKKHQSHAKISEDVLVVERPAAAVLFTMNVLENGIMRNPPMLSSPVVMNAFRYCKSERVFFK